MRILAVANWDPHAHPIPWAAERLRALQRAGVQVDLLARPTPDARSWLELVLALDARLHQRRYDAVAPLYGSLLGLICALQRRAPCVVSFAGSDLNGSPDRRLSVPLSQLAAALACSVSVRTRAMRAALWWPRARDRARVIPSGVDVRRFRPRDRREARLKRGVAVEGKRVLFVAGHGARREKNLALAGAAVARLDGVQLEVAARVPFAEMPLVYASADALVLTSLSEGSPNCVKEALACGVPVVSVDVGDAREVLSGLTNCALVPADAGAVAGALERVLTDGRGCPEGPARMAEAFSLEAMAQAFVALYSVAQLR